MRAGRDPTFALTAKVVRVRSVMLHVPWPLIENSKAGPNETVAPVVPSGTTLRCALTHAGFSLHEAALDTVILPVVWSSADTAAS